MNFDELLSIGEAPSVLSVRAVDFVHLYVARGDLLPMCIEFLEQVFFYFQVFLFSLLKSCFKTDQSDFFCKFIFLKSLKNLRYD